MLYRLFYLLSFLLFNNVLLVDDDRNHLLIYGDSISAGYGMDKDKQWSEELKRILIEEKINIKIINKSLSGETTGGGLSRLMNIINSAQPSYILIELGGNDALRGYPPAKIKKKETGTYNELTQENPLKIHLNKLAYRHLQNISGPYRCLKYQEL